MQYAVGLLFRVGIRSSTRLRIRNPHFNSINSMNIVSTISLLPVHPISFKIYLCGTIIVRVANCKNEFRSDTHTESKRKFALPLLSRLHLLLHYKIEINFFQSALPLKWPSIKLHIMHCAYGTHSIFTIHITYSVLLCTVLRPFECESCTHTHTHYSPEHNWSDVHRARCALIFAT